jgi:stage V sporulation protein S
MDIIRVSATSRTSAVAGAIAGVVRDHMRAEVQAIGAGAVNQAMKALILATGYLRGDGIEVCAVPEFVDVEIEGNIRTAIKLVVGPRHPSSGDTQSDSGKLKAESEKLKAESEKVDVESGKVEAEAEADS